MPRKSLFLLLAFACLPCSLATAQTANSYGSYYQKKIKQPEQRFRGANVNEYLFDKYYKTNRNVSPYANLNRGALSGTGYQNQVRPEQQRRAAFQSNLKGYISDKKSSGHIGHTDYGFAQQLQRGVPNAADIPKVQKPSAYYNNWYSK